MAKYTKAQRCEIASLAREFAAYKTAVTDEELELFADRLQNIQYQSGIELIYHETLANEINSARLRQRKV